ncbi:hypothetical protein Y032_0017g3322 [Ancylostoma ceylanicum]|nr:hypothetical protein Y032_0017g3322 [Ancylostoma ceylanicum]
MNSELQAIQKRVGVGVFLRGKHNGAFDKSCTFYPISRTVQCFACSYTRHVKSWKLSAISNWKRAKTCLAYNNWRDLPHLGSLTSGRIGETDSM